MTGGEAKHESDLPQLPETACEVCRTGAVGLVVGLGDTYPQ
jgi:hypothetical protein